MIVYLDLDRTLFQTDETATIWKTIAELYPEVDPIKAYEEREKYCVYVGDQYYYEMSRHLQSFELEPEFVYEQIRTSGLADGRFEFEGCRELINSLEQYADVRIFTFGADDFQRFKASLCPSLLGLPIVTTLRAKAEVLDDGEEECWLVDDKPIGDELPGSVSFVQVSLEGKPVPSDAIWPVFYSLHDLREFFDDLMH